MTRGIVTMRDLNTRAQWGNMVIMYAALRTYAKRYDLDYECPKWAGQYLFGHADSPITHALPSTTERYEGSRREVYFGTPVPPVGDEWVNRNINGWCQFHTSWYAPDREFIQNLYVPVEPERSRVAPMLEQLKSRGNTIITVHIRRGDSGRLIYFYLPMTWILKWLHEHWSRFDSPVLFIATEDTSFVKHFWYYKPVIAEDLGAKITGTPPIGYAYPHIKDTPDPRSLDFFPDWYIIQNSDVVLASDSTFSVSASWTSKVNRELWMPRLSLQKFEHVNPWSMHFSGREHLDDYPGIPGTQIDENKQFSKCWDGFKPKHKSVPETPEMIAKYERPSCK